MIAAAPPAPSAPQPSKKLDGAEAIRMQDDSENTSPDSASPQPSWLQAAAATAKAHWPKARQFVIDNFLPLSFAVAVIFAMAYPLPGERVVAVSAFLNIRTVQTVNMIIVFFISGLALKTEDLRKAKDCKAGVVYGFVAIIVVTPVLGFALKAVPLQPPEFAVGLAIYALMPTTLGVGVALVRTCKGNEGLALFLTVFTNILGVATIPAELRLLFLGDNSLSMDIDQLYLFLKLLITVLVPSVLGKLLRECWRPALNFATKYRISLGLFSTTNLAFIIWQTLSGARNTLVKQQGSHIVAVIALAIAQHLFYLALNWAVVSLFLRVPLPEAAAVIIMSSQKSAPVAVTVINFINSNPASQGLMAIPCITGQIAQIFIGSALAPYIAAVIARDKKAAEGGAKGTSVCIGMSGINVGTGKSFTVDGTDQAAAAADNSDHSRLLDRAIADASDELPAIDGTHCDAAYSNEPPDRV